MPASTMYVKKKRPSYVRRCRRLHPDRHREPKKASYFQPPSCPCHRDGRSHICMFVYVCMHVRARRARASVVSRVCLLCGPISQSKSTISAVRDRDTEKEVCVRDFSIERRERGRKKAKKLTHIVILDRARHRWGWEE